MIKFFDLDMNPINRIESNCYIQFNDTTDVDYFMDNSTLGKEFYMINLSGFKPQRGTWKYNIIDGFSLHTDDIIDEDIEAELSKPAYFKKIVITYEMKYGTYEFTLARHTKDDSFKLYRATLDSKDLPQMTSFEFAKQIAILDSEINEGFGVRRQETYLGDDNDTDI